MVRGVQVVTQDTDGCGYKYHQGISTQSKESLQHVKDACTTSHPPILWVYGRACVAPLDFPLAMLSNLAPPVRFLPRDVQPGLEEATKGKPFLLLACMSLRFSCPFVWLKLIVAPITPSHHHNPRNRQQLPGLNLLPPPSSYYNSSLASSQADRLAFHLPNLLYDRLACSVTPSAATSSCCCSSFCKAPGLSTFRPASPPTRVVASSHPLQLPTPKAKACPACPAASAPATAAATAAATPSQGGTRYVTPSAIRA